MTQEDKELLLKDLCARIPYGVKGIIKGGDVVTTPLKWYAEQTLELSIGYMVVKNGWRPYLFPLSSMTEEQKREYDKIIYHSIELHHREYSDIVEIDLFDDLQDFYCKNHLDYRCLIERGLAIDATGLNVY